MLLNFELIMEEEIFFEEEEQEKKKGPLKFILAVFLIFLIIVMIIPLYGIRIDPQPERIPSIEEVFVYENNDLMKETITLKTQEDFLHFFDPTDPLVKRTANKIVSIACSGEKICHAKAIYYFLRDNFDYISDPVNFEYVEKPQDMLFSGGGDCESGTLLMANLMEAVGIDSELVFIPNHAFLRIKLPEASKRYKQDQLWVYLDWTCKQCDFGEIPIGNLNQRMNYLGLY
jgi:hypothetical protein